MIGSGERGGSGKRNLYSFETHKDVRFFRGWDGVCQSGQGQCTVCRWRVMIRSCKTCRCEEELRVKGGRELYVVVWHDNREARWHLDRVRNLERARAEREGAFYKKLEQL